MKNGLITFALIAFVCVLVSCSQQPIASSNNQQSTQNDVINMDSDYSIEKHLPGTWTYVNGGITYTLVFKEEGKMATFKFSSNTYSGNYRVSERRITCDMHSYAYAPTLFVHELTSTTLEVTGVGNSPISLGNMVFTKNN